MARGTVPPFLEPGTPLPKRPGPFLEPLPSTSATASSRATALSSVVLPYLRRLDIGDDMPAHHKTPLLTLKLSSPSFLDSDINDDFSQHPLYSIRTVGITTTILRSDPWDGAIQTAEVKWPQVVPFKGKAKDPHGVLIRMNGARWMGGENLLRPGSFLSAPRKFNIPNYPQNLKWKRVGNSYWCTAATVKGPIATLDLAVASVPPRLKVFETLRDKYDARPMLVHHSVSILLLDYLLVTSLLLVTDVQEWMVVKKHEDQVARISFPQARASDEDTPITSTSASQWRKIIYGEPLYPKRLSHTASPPPPDNASLTPTSPDQMAKIIYGEPIYPTLRRSSADMLGSGVSDGYSDDESSLPYRSRPASPSTESIFYPLTNSSAPSHTYLDPLFYHESNAPPVPPIPPRFVPSSGSRPSTPVSTTSSGRIRELPPVPQLPSRTRFSVRPATSHASLPSRGIEQPLTDSASAFPSPLPGRQRPWEIPFDRIQSSRPLPRTPSQGPIESSTRVHAIRHVQSQTHLSPQRPREKRASQQYRSLPPTPSAAVVPPVTPVEDAGAVQIVSQPQRRRRMQKDQDDDDAWMRSLTTPRARRPSTPEPAATVFDVPPPAYSSINFDARVQYTISPPRPDPR